jgi:predicted ATP-grasp superfamily ATP-dependent carboligase
MTNRSSDLMDPCVVLGLESQIGLGIVRELGRAGVPVIGISHSASAIGLRSRYLKRGIVIDRPRSDELLQCLQQLGDEYGEASLITISESNLNWLLINRSHLGRLRPVLPRIEALETVLDKQKTLAIAEEIGIQVPRTAEPKSFDALDTLAGEISYPVVLKWKDPNSIGPLLDKHKIPMLKAEYAGSAKELRAIGQRYIGIGKWPLIQEYCAGTGLGQFFYMHKGQALRRFQHLRIAEWPPEGGFSSVCDSIPISEHMELQEKSIALLQAIGWEGVAMVEYRFDPLNNRSVLMEINGRFWGSFPLAVQCGAGFALLAHYVQGQGKPATLGQLQGRWRCRMVGTEVKRLFRILLQSDKIRDPYFIQRPRHELLRFIVDFFRSNVSYYIWSADDPAPFFKDLSNMLLRRN